VSDAESVVRAFFDDCGDQVLTERIDHLDDESGNRIASLPVAGTLEVRGGKIVAWRDYFDPRPLLPEG